MPNCDELSEIVNNRAMRANWGSSATLLRLASHAMKPSLNEQRCRIVGRRRP